MKPTQADSEIEEEHLLNDEDETEALYSSQAKRGTTAFHAYATLYARVRNKGTRWRFAS